MNNREHLLVLLNQIYGVLGLNITHM